MPLSRTVAPYSSTHRRPPAADPWAQAASTALHTSYQYHRGLLVLVKRGIAGIHDAVSAKGLQGYLNEHTWRYNHRDDGQVMLLTLLLRSATTSM